MARAGRWRVVRVQYGPLVIVVFAALFVCLGLWNLFAPPSLLLLGNRWQWKDGDDVEPSTLFVVGARVSGVVLVGVAVVMVWGTVTLDGERDRRERFDSAWAIGYVSPGIGEDEMVLTTSLPVFSLDADPDLLAPEGTTSALRFAVVGSESVGPEFDVEGASAGDLVVRISPLACEPVRLLVEEDAAIVRLSVVVAPGTTSPWSGVVPSTVGEVEGCDEPDYPRMVTSFEVVHVPLSSPFGDRVLIDAPSGATVPTVGQAAADGS